MTRPFHGQRDVDGAVRNDQVDAPRKYAGQTQHILAGGGPGLVERVDDQDDRLAGPSPVALVGGLLEEVLKKLRPRG